jgi:hypothetical protein
MLIKIYAERALKLHALYLLLLVRRKGYAKKVKVAKKVFKFINIAKLYINAGSLLRNNKLYKILREVLMRIVPRQPYTEVDVITSTKTHLNALLQDCPLFDKQVKLASTKGTYLGFIPLKISFNFSTLNLNERYFFFTFLNIARFKKFNVVEPKANADDHNQNNFI